MFERSLYSQSQAYANMIIQVSPDIYLVAMYPVSDMLLYNFQFNIFDIMLEGRLYTQAQVCANMIIQISPDMYPVVQYQISDML